MNEAADRLRDVMNNGSSITQEDFIARNALLDEALSDERRIVVDRIRAALPTSGMWWLKDLFAILDAESER